MTNLSLIRKALPASVTLKAGRALLQAQHQSPHILFGAGVVGFFGTTILASRATLQVEDVLSETKRKLVDVNLLVEGKFIDDNGFTQNVLPNTKYSEEDATKDRLYIYSRVFVDITKLYGPAVVVGGLTLFAFSKAHTIQNARIGALTAAYAGLDKAFSKYRDRVRAEFGDEKELDLRYDAKPDLIAITNPDTLKKETIEAKRIGEGAYSPYARFFDEYNDNWKKNAELNFLFLRAQQNYCNDLLKSRGHLFLNEVYDMLGIERSQAGAVVGWVIGDEGDNFVDFGFMDNNNPRARAFVNGLERSVFLDFNVDGVIYDKI